MKLVFIYGMPAAGKLTVARELAKMTGFKLFHNHLAVDLLLSTFEFGSKPFVELREEIWLSVFRQACRSDLPGLIFTFAPERTVRATFVDEAVQTVGDEGGEVDFVELTCPIDELKQRLDSASRREFGKLTSAELFDELRADGVFGDSQMPKAKATIDTSMHAPREAAVLIANALGLNGR
jgi:hypothetical protein